ncbi:MAG: hypothetical protein ACI93T_004679 [Porticoccaceae bacterium]|jgi:hypothetical protein
MSVCVAQQERVDEAVVEDFVGEFETFDAAK